ncbi:MAG TPA: YcnI family protein [Acidimicrobiales bacterium]|jgi:uncharacterized protein YcnI|nr:YcnI family protein [Acidimicrobiales bacterium]
MLALAAPALAHVTVDPDSVPQRAGDATITFRVPNEEANADTTKVDIQFPTDHAIAAVDVLTPTNGFTAQVTMKHLDTPITTDDGTFSDVVAEIAWSGGKISPGQFGEFKVLAMGIPTGVDSLKFPAVQTYSDGNVVSWIQDTPAGGPAPDHPAPVLTLTPAAASSSSSSSPSSSASASSQSQLAAAPATTVKKETSGVGVAALVVAIIALLAAGIGLLRRRPAGTS